MKGAFQVSREMFDHSIWNDVPKFRIFFFILGNAVFSNEGVKKGNVHIGRGQFLRSYRNLQSDLEYIENRAVKKYSLSVVKRKISSLIDEKMLEIEETELGTLFTVVNYAQYQGFEHYKNGTKNSVGTALEHSENRDGTALEQGWNNNKNVKKEKNVKIKDSSPKRVYDDDSDEMKLTMLFIKRIKINNPDFKMPNTQKWSDDFRKMIQLDKRDKKEIQEIILFVQSDPFEMPNVLSPSKMRARYDNLKMKKNQPKKPELIKTEQKAAQVSKYREYA